MVGSGRKVLSEVREWSGSPPECPRLVSRPSRISGSAWEALAEVWKCLGVVGRHYRRFESDREAVPEVRESSESSQGGSGEVVRPYQRSGSSREALPEVR